jgi:hypothetical protein
MMKTLCSRRAGNAAGWAENATDAAVPGVRVPAQAAGRRAWAGGIADE